MKLENLVSLKESVLNEAKFAMDDIAIGGTAIYKTLRGYYKMSKVKDKSGMNVRMMNGDTVQNAAIVSTDQSDWSQYKDATVKEGVKIVEKEVQLLSEECITAINTLLSEGQLSQFRPPFTSNGLWVSDSSGTDVLEVISHGKLASDVAAALNKYFSGMKKEATELAKWVVKFQHGPKESDYINIEVDANSSGMAVAKAKNELPTKFKSAKVMDIAVKKTVKEASHLNDVTIAGMKDEDHDFQVGDEVKVVGHVAYLGERGTVKSFDSAKKFVIVDLENSGTKSFHFSDLELDDGTGVDVSDEMGEKSNSFYVSMFDHDERAGWIGELSKSNGKWVEHVVSGKPSYAWGQTYMGYLSPQEVMTWIRKDYSRGYEVDGPFDTESEAQEALRDHMDMNESALSEALTYTDFDDWKAAVLQSYPAQSKKIKFKGRMEGKKMTISAEIPGEDRSYGVWDQDEDKGVVLSEGTSPFKPNTKVMITKGPKDVVGKMGYIGEIKTDVSGKRTFVVDYTTDSGRQTSVSLSPDQVKLCKDMK